MSKPEVIGDNGWNQGWLGQVNLEEQTIMFKFLNRVRGPTGQELDRIPIGKKGKWPSARATYDAATQAYLIYVDGKLKMVLHNVQCVEVME